MLIPTRTVRAVIRGRVQGVWYRGWAVETATALGLNGWIRNCRNGSVEAVFSGPSEAVESMLAHCHQGSALRAGDVGDGIGLERDPARRFSPTSEPVNHFRAVGYSIKVSRILCAGSGSFSPHFVLTAPRAAQPPRAAAFRTHSKSWKPSHSSRGYRPNRPALGRLFGPWHSRTWHR